MDSAHLRDIFPNLTQLFGAYLNQDYTLCGPELFDAVHAFVSDSSAETLNQTRAEIAQFVSINGDDLYGGLDRLTYGDYAYDPDMKPREYLQWIDGVLAEGLQGKRSS